MDSGGDIALRGRPQAVEGQTFTNVPVFYFTDADPNATVSNYTAVVKLGDGNSVTLTGTPSSNGQIVRNFVSGIAEGFQVQLSYTYAEELSNKTFSVQVSDVGGSSTSASTSTFSVADAPLTAGSAVTLGGDQKVALSGVQVASFTDANPNSTTGDFKATIKWETAAATSSGSISESGTDLRGDRQPRLRNGWHVHRQRDDYRRGRCDDGRQLYRDCSFRPAAGSRVAGESG